MKLDRYQRHTRLSWFFVGAMLVLCGVLGVLQYRWIDEASRAESMRLRGSLQGSLARLSIDFNTTVVNACSSFLPRPFMPDASPVHRSPSELYRRWRETTQHEGLFSAIGIVTAEADALKLQLLDLQTGEPRSADWPESWVPMKDYLNERIAMMREGREGPGRPGGRFRPPNLDDGFLLEFPVRGRMDPDSRALPEWYVFEVSERYIRHTLLPDLLNHHIGSGLADYQVEVVPRRHPHQILYRSPDQDLPEIGESADASTPLFDAPWDQVFRRTPPPGIRDAMRGRPMPPPSGRLELRIRHRSGSVDTIVAKTRARNLAVTSAVLLLMLGAAAALASFARRAQRLATLQMNFVAGVSHELRTPLAVIRTAAYNLRGKLAQNPAQVEKYGVLIQRESERLTSIVEDVLKFASQNAEHARFQFEPLSVTELIDSSLAASQAALDSAHVTVDRKIQPGLPLVMGDPVALQHALQNRISNAVKYGASEQPWIGISAAPDGADCVEIRVSDRGPGIPSEEIASVFDPFFRGQRAVQDQIHGTGLGLALVKGIVEAHSGSVAVSSLPGRLTEFALRIPAADPGVSQDFTQ
ncbi:MAG: HAMP domain-containing histidine kinase [Acidobacteria bacterium]|nr:HAMP domain-containing histidine kinase [Acidobacteriota bacterium]